MGGFRLLGFECKKQCSSLTFLIILAIFTAFSFSQLTEIFHLPVQTEQDIQALNQSGEHDYILVGNTEADFVAQSVQFLRQRLEEGSVPQEIAAELNSMTQMLEDGTHSFDDVMLLMQDNEVAFPWLLACKAQFSQRLGSVSEANQMIQGFLGNTGYSPVLYAKYVTYMQIVGALLIFPLFIFLFTRDYRYSMYEMVYAQPIHFSKYIILRYLGAFIPLALFLYVFGLILNIISTSRFIVAGYEYQYTAFFPVFITYLFPTIFFFSSLIMLLMLLIKKVVAMFPLYVIFVLMNVTPDVFGVGDLFRGISPIIRLDETTNSMEAVIINRIIYLVLGAAFLVVACALYKRLRHDLRKGITI